MKKIGNAALVKSAFEEEFRSRLEPFGFKIAKTGNLYCIRMINDEIIHIIGLREMVDSVVPFGAVATVYRQDLCLNKSFRQNEGWFKTVMHFYANRNSSDIGIDSEPLFGYSYLSYGDPETVKTAVKNACDAALTWIFPVLDRIQTFKDVLDYQRNMGVVPDLPLAKNQVAPYSDTAVYFLLDDPLSDLDERRKAAIKAVAAEDEQFLRSQEVIDKNKADYEKMFNESCRRLRLFQENEEIHSQTLEELARRKEHNLKLLKRYGIERISD